LGYKVFPILSTVVISAVCFYLLILLLLTVLQHHLIYMPQKHLFQTPESDGLVYKAVRFKTEDGIDLSGWFVPASPSGRGDSERVVLFCHGNAGNMSNRLDSICVFHRLGLSVFLFDYRGYGQSGGHPTEKGTYLDAEAAWRVLTKGEAVLSSGRNAAVIPRFTEQATILFGRSLGGAVATWLATKYRPRSLILESTLKSAPALAAKFFPYLPVQLLLRYRYNTLEYIRQIRCPVLIVHSRQDEIVPFEHGLMLYEAAKEPKSFLEISGSHNSGFLTSLEKYEGGLRSFLSKY
jgi:fermentation-respiration switch protein FrsA (DUF1100 family)